MSSTQLINPRQICENLLIAGIRYNSEHAIWPSENAIAECMLTRGEELRDAYCELYAKLNEHPEALGIFLQLLLNTAAFWNPEKLSEARADRDALVNVNRQIAKKAGELSGLLELRSRLHNSSGFSSGTHYHVCKVLKAAAKDNGLFNSYVENRLSILCGQFDLKYWPSLSEFLSELSFDAEGAVAEASDALTAAGTTAARPSRADFFKALFVAIEENNLSSYGRLPEKFRLSDNTLASLANCALNLMPDALIDGAYVKRLRQRQRNENTNG